MTVREVKGKITSVLWSNAHLGSVIFLEDGKKQKSRYYYTDVSFKKRLMDVSNNCILRVDVDGEVIEVVSDKWSGMVAADLVEVLKEILDESYYISGTEATNKHGGYKTIHFMEERTIQRFLFIDGGNLNGKESMRIYGGIKLLEHNLDMLLDVWYPMRGLDDLYPFKIKIIRKGKPKMLPEKVAILQTSLEVLGQRIDVAKKTYISFEDYDSIIKVFMEKQRVSAVSNHFLYNTLYSKLHTKGGYKRKGVEISVFDLALGFMDLAADTYYTPSKRMQIKYKQIAGELIMLSPRWKEYMEKIEEMI